MEKQTRKEMQATYKERKVIGGICAIKNTANGKMLVSAVVDIQGYKNRFAFSKSTGGCVSTKLQKDWNEFGADAFTFEVLEELIKKETQTPKEFSDDIKMLEEIWLEKLDLDILY